ncbi:GlcG/HbpS family heme-binding protein [Nocardioides caldifontis]|uniref:GlcG/HbpS family heme-binding protein n=1 Tax=Nocardioides caldifontis TaxID=2588938 RepID=UPI0011E01472|nr:heme-binding protein [Nocardioides caldifontis]
MTALTLVKADELADAVLAQGRSSGAAPLAVVVLDPGGHVVVAKREDGAGILRIEIATAKAYGALGMGMSSRAIGERAEKQPTFFGTLASVSDGRLAPAAGGVLVHGADGTLLGAVGVSGDTSDVDEGCVLAGIEAAGLR